MQKMASSFGPGHGLLALNFMWSSNLDRVDTRRLARLIMRVKTTLGVDRIGYLAITIRNSTGNDKKKSIFKLLFLNLTRPKTNYEKLHILWTYFRMNCKLLLSFDGGMKRLFFV
jgi:hypothetical protein